MADKPMTISRWSPFAVGPDAPTRLVRVLQVAIAGALIAAWMGAAEALLVTLSRTVPEPALFIRKAVVGYAAAGAALGVLWGALIEVPTGHRPWRRRAFHLAALAGMVLCFQLVLHAGMHWIANRLIPDMGRSIKLTVLAAGPLLVGLLVLWLICRRWRPPTRWAPVLGPRWAITLAAPLLLLVALPTLLALATPKQNGSMPNVLMIVLDTTRADHLSAYGYDRPTSPHLDRLAAEGLTFTRAFSAAPWTLPSHASMFTGEYPTTHNTHFEQQILDTRLPTLAEHMGSLGFRTAAFSRQVWLCDETGLMRGFQDFYDLYWRSTTALIATTRLVREQIRIARERDDKGAEQISRTFRGWIDRHGEEPFFAFINFVEPHAEYRPPAPYREQFLTDAHRDTPWGREQHVEVQGFNAGRIEYSETDLAVFRELYDGAVAYQDARMGEVIDHLRERRLLDSTLVIVTSDHGENLGDHGLLGHEFCVYNTLLHVPLIVRLPDVVPAGARNDSVVENRLIWSLIDLILEADSGDGPQPPEQLAAAMRVDEQVGAPAMAELYRRPISGPVWDGSPNEHLLKRRLRALQVRDMKFIWASDDRNELYDLDRDPGELINLVSLRKEEREALAALLQAKVDGLDTVTTDESGEFSEDLKRRLRSLGYLD